MENTGVMEGACGMGISEIMHLKGIHISTIDSGEASFVGWLVGRVVLSSTQWVIEVPSTFRHLKSEGQCLEQPSLPKFMFVAIGWAYWKRGQEWRTLVLWR